MIAPPDDNNKDPSIFDRLMGGNLAGPRTRVAVLITMPPGMGVAEVLDRVGAMNVSTEDIVAVVEYEPRKQTPTLQMV
jgi:hypothetical protein